MFDMAALAFQANITRIFSMMMTREASNLTYRSDRRAGRVPSGVASPEQPAEDREAGQRSRPITPRFSRVSSAKLTSMPDGDGSMLDHSHDAVRQQHEQQQHA